ncbi:MAG: hypothetical protein M3Y07_12260 [Acidobacteriota bacterium]|nr:hypothetical protein [Acidobacteriota bacterium]
MLLAVAPEYAAAPPIGIAIASGTFTLDRQFVPGNATVFDGNTIETSRSPSQITLAGGTRLQLGESSRGVFHEDYLELEKGVGQLDMRHGYRIEALSLKIASAQGSASARISIDREQVVRVAALSGTVRVANRDGVLVASLAAGKSLEFEVESEAGAAAPSHLKGCLVKSGNRYKLKDETASVTAELRGSGLDGAAGSQVEVLGKIVPNSNPAEGTTQVIQVLKLDQLSEKCGASGSLDTPASKARILGMSKSTAVIAGIGIAAAAAIPAIAMNRDGNPKQISPSSR